MENTQQPARCICERCYSEAPLNSVEFHPFSRVKSKEFGLTPTPKGRKAAAIHPRLVLTPCIPISSLMQHSTTLGAFLKQ